MKAEEHPLSQKLPLGICDNCGCGNAERDLKVELLKAEQERDALKKQNGGLKDVIIGLEETISKKDAKLKAILKGLRTIKEFSGPTVTINQVWLDKWVTDLISQHSK